MPILLNTNDVLRKIFGTSEYFSDISSVKNFLEARLLGDQSIVEPLPPFEYLLGCYRRISEQIKEISLIGDDIDRSSLGDIVWQCKELVITYCRLYLNDPNLFLQHERRVSRSKLIIGLVIHGESSPPGFLDDLFSDSSFNGKETIFQEMYNDLRNRVGDALLGDFENSLKALKVIYSLPNGGRALVNHNNWIPKGRIRVNGRNMEVLSTLGQFFRISAIPDIALYESDNDVPNYYHQHEYASAAIMIQNGLGEIFRSLLKNTETRERALEYIAEMINKNSARAKMHASLYFCASSGTFVNLSVVMLRLCEPFLDSNHCVDIDPSYVFGNTRIEFTQLTRLHASSQEYATLKQSHGAGKQNYTLINDYFFMTSRVLHLGIIKTISEYKDISQELSEKEEHLSKLKNNLDENHPSRELKEDILHLQKHVDKLQKRKLCYEAQLVNDITYLEAALGFYRLVLVWLVDLVGTSPMLFACMPEHFVDDAMEMLLFAFEVPKALDGIILDDYIKFIIMFMGSPEHIRNPFLRAKMVLVLKSWTKIKNTEPLFEGNEVLAINLARSCLKFYVDIEATGSYIPLDDKIEIRNNISKLLICLWEVPRHQTAWKEIAKIEKGVYLNFLNSLINDSIYLLDRTFDTVAELKLLEAEISNKDEWERKSAQEREKKLRRVDLLKRAIPSEFKPTKVNVKILESTMQLTTSPFLLPAMVERVANTLNHFLLQLTHQEKNFRGLLEKIARLYVHLERGDGENNVLSAAISRDGRSYNPKLFTNAVNILNKRGADIELVQEFTKIGEKASTAALEALSAEEALGDIPEEFLDPIQYTLMKDPVILPISKQAIDRHVIQRHLLSNSSDPFNRSYLTQDMLIPAIELKAKIEEFVRSKSQGCGR